MKAIPPTESAWWEHPTGDSFVPTDAFLCVSPPVPGTRGHESGAWRCGEQRGPQGDPIPELAPTHPMAEGSVPLLEIKLRVLGYQRGGLFIMSAVKLVRTLVGAISKPLPDNHCALLMHKQPVFDSSLAKIALNHK